MLCLAHLVRKALGNMTFDVDTSLDKNCTFENELYIHNLYAYILKFLEKSIQND